MPPISALTIMRIFLAGAAATVIFDLFGQAISPMLGFASLAPIPLATQTWGVIFGTPYSPGGHFLHYVAGLVAYPIGWLFIFRPIQERIIPGLPWLVSATLYGVGLWILALYILAHWIAGNPPFLGFTGITWVALIGHIIYAIVAAWVFRWLAAR